MNITEFTALPLQQRFRLFVEWLGEQEPEGRYNFYDIEDCALCRFGKSALGIQEITAGASSIMAFLPGKLKVVQVDVLPNGVFGLLRSGTYGAAFSKLRRATGIPRRPFWRPLAIRVLSRFVKFDRPLAA